jgi:hypothetical protein
VDDVRAVSNSCLDSAAPGSLSHSRQLTDGNVLPQILQLLLLVVTERALLVGRYTIHAID